VNGLKVDGVPIARQLNPAGETIGKIIDKDPRGDSIARPNNPAWD